MSAKDCVDLEAGVAPKATKKRKNNPKGRKWMVTLNNPFDFLTWVKVLVYVKSLLPDLKFMCGALEEGKEKLKESDPHYGKAPAKNGGRVHWQLYIECKNQYYASIMSFKIFNGYWAEFAKSPENAATYCTKGDNTLLDGPFEWGEMETQGKRTDLEDCYQKIKSGEDFNSLVKKGQCLGALAKYPQFWNRVTGIIQAPEVTKAFPLTILGKTMEKPDPANKQRHWWIHGPCDWGKSYTIQVGLRGYDRFYCKGNNKNRLEAYAGQEIIVLDDCVMTFEMLAGLCDTHEDIYYLEARNWDRMLKAGSSRNIIVINNRSIDQIGFSNPDGVKARFKEIDCTKWFPKYKGKKNLVKPGRAASAGDKYYVSPGCPACGEAQCTCTYSSSSSSSSAGAAADIDDITRRILIEKQMDDVQEEEVDEEAPTQKTRHVIDLSQE